MAKKEERGRGGRASRNAARGEGGGLVGARGGSQVVQIGDRSEGGG